MAYRSAGTPRGDNRARQLGLVAEGFSVPRERGLTRILQPPSRFQRVAYQAGHQPAERHMLLARFFAKLLQKIGRQRHHHLRSRVHDQSPLAIYVTDLPAVPWTSQFTCQAPDLQSLSIQERRFQVAALIQCYTLPIET